MYDGYTADHVASNFFLTMQPNNTIGVNRLLHESIIIICPFSPRGLIALHLDGKWSLSKNKMERVNPFTTKSAKLTNEKKKNSNVLYTEKQTVQHNSTAE